MASVPMPLRLGAMSCVEVTALAAYEEAASMMDIDGTTYIETEHLEAVATRG